ncbi:MAG: hypothetical protein IJX91_05670 [Clostridia bacterium]|nr:hypothetical protein [Clostridia bacterium]
MQEQTENGVGVEKEKESLKLLMGVEDLAEKKIKIFSRLLMDAALAGDMEKLALRHEKRKEKIEKLVFGKAQKKKATQGEEEDEE